MFLHRLYLRHFRNYTEAMVSFDSGVNLILGGNAQGKTNLLEAIYFLGTGRSFRTVHLRDLIQEGKTGFTLEAHFVKDTILQRILVSFDGQTKRVVYNHTNYANFTSLLGLLPMVLYAPEDVALVSGSPLERRRFLDVQIAQADPLYVHHLTRYYRAMKQRNCLLRSKSQTAFEAWENAMSLSAAYLLGKRKEALDDLNAFLSPFMQELSEGKDTLQMRYQSTLPCDNEQNDLASLYLSLFQKNRPREIFVGNTLIGPHRDDLLITVNQKPAKGFSSEGQKRCCIAALRLAEWQRLLKMNGSSPLMSIDDFGTHLDPERSSLLQRKLSGLGQVFLTSPHFQEGGITSAIRHTLVVEKGNVLQD